MSEERECRKVRESSTTTRIGYTRELREKRLRYQDEGSAVEGEENEGSGVEG